MEDEIDEILKVCKKRRDMGRLKYGDDFSKDMLVELKEELYDVINYAMLELIKINKTIKKRDDALDNSQ